MIYYKRLRHNKFTPNTYVAMPQSHDVSDHYLADIYPQFGSLNAKQRRSLRDYQVGKVEQAIWAMDRAAKKWQRVDREDIPDDLMSEVSEHKARSAHVDKSFDQPGPVDLPQDLDQ